MKNSVAIIGAGVAGLAAGVYLRLNGYETDIYEMHTLPGGLCTAWKRGGYTFDFCIHWLMGSSPSSRMHRVWSELGATQNRRFVEWDSHLEFRSRSGETFTLFTDPDKLEREMLRLGPSDRARIRGFIQGLKKFSRFDFPLPGDSGPVLLEVLFKTAGLIPAFLKWGPVAMKDFAARFRSPVLREFFESFYDPSDLPDFPVMGFLIMMGFMAKRSNGYPVGGSLEFARAIEKRYLSLGGRVHYGHRVTRILVQDGRAQGIAANGKEFRADRVISAADGFTTLSGLLEGKHTTPAIRKIYEQTPVFPSLLYVCLGIGRDLSGLPHSVVFHPKKTIVTENGALKLDTLSPRFFHFDPTMAPKGKTSCILMIQTRNHEYWTNLKAADPSGYERKKSALADQVVEALDEEFGNIRDFVEITDVATPATIIRYTGNWKGSYEGFLPTRANMGKDFPHTLPGLKGFYMIGQWTTPGGGLPPCGIGARRIAMRICGEDGKKAKFG